MSTKYNIKIKSNVKKPQVDIQDEPISKSEPAFLKAIKEKREVKKVKIPSRASNRRPALRRSIFFMTISTNININTLIPDHQKEFHDDFQDACREFFYDNDGKIVSDHMELRDSKEVNESFQDIPLHERIVSADINYKVEVGPRGILHCHIRMTTSQRAVNVKLDYNSVREWFFQRLGYKIYFYRENSLTDIKTTLDDYIDKQMEYY